MKAFTADRERSDRDEIWLTEHEPVFTQGQAGKAEHLLAPGDIPWCRPIAADRSPTTAPGRSSAI
jgi:lipoate-protein ligase B